MPGPAFQQQMPLVLLSPTRPALRFREIAFSFTAMVLVCVAYSATLVLAVTFKPQCMGKHHHLCPSWVLAVRKLRRLRPPHSITHGNACFTYFNKIWGNWPAVLPSQRGIALRKGSVASSSAAYT